MKIILYGDKNGYFTNVAKAWLLERGLSYEDRDVADGDNLENVFAVSEQYAVPVFVVGSEVVIGLDKERLIKLTEKSS